MKMQAGIMKTVFLLIIVFSFNSLHAESRFGIYRATPLPEESFDNVFKELKELGISEISHFPPYDLESAQIAGDSIYFDQVYDKAIENNMAILPWVRARDNNDCSRVGTDQMKTYLAQVVKKYTHLMSFKILKETDVPCRNQPRLGTDVGIDPDECIAIAKAARATLDKECPDCKLVWGGFGPIVGSEYYNRLLNNKFFDNFDVLGYVAYKWDNIVSYRPEVFKEEWVLETAVDQIDEKVAAKETVKLITHLFSMGFSKVFYSSLYDFSLPQASMAGNKFQRMGLIGLDKRKKEVYYSFKNLINKLDGFVAVTRLPGTCFMETRGPIKQGPTGDCFYKFTFKNRKPVYVLWSTDNLSLPPEIIGLNKITSTDYLGNSKFQEAEELSLNKNPVFVESR